jgi:hypothetical protein
MDAMDPAEVAAILNKLKVGKGGRGSRQKLCGDYSVGFSENTGGAAHQPYKLTLYKGTRPQSMGLERDHVFSKTRAQWVRDRVWRIEPTVVDRVADQIASVVKCPVKGRRR